MDGEPDAGVTATIFSQPDKGTLEYRDGVTYILKVPAGEGGAPYTTLEYTITDSGGLSSGVGVATVTVFCPEGHFINQVCSSH
jgi:hypothetical protein